MKKLILVVALAIGCMATADAQKKPFKLKKHTCTESCHKAGKCVYAHGEKGHTCTDECKKSN
jgi:hypothetical protein